MNVYASPEDCTSWLGKRMQAFRCDRPSEWMMDEFIREADRLDTTLKAATGFIDSHVADPDITNEMVEKYAAYQAAVKNLEDNQKA